MYTKKLSTSRLIGSLVFTLLSTAVLLIAACTLEAGIDTLYKDAVKPKPPGPPQGTYTVTFDNNDGTPDITTKTVAAGGTLGNDMPNPTRIGYNFVEWSTRQTGNGTVFTAATPVTGNITVYAQWRVDWTSLENSDDEPTVLAKIKEENIKYWVDDDVLAVYAQDNVPDEEKTHLYFIYSKITGGSITITAPAGWTINPASPVTVNQTIITPITLDHTTSNASYALELWPVAQYEIVFEKDAAGTVTITDSTDPIANVSITAADTQRTRYAIGSVDGATTIKITSGIRIAVKDEDGPVDITETSPGSGYDTFNPAISSQEYTITVSPTLTEAAAQTYIKGADIKDWVVDPDILARYAQDKVPAEERTQLYFIESKIVGTSISFYLPPGWTIDGGTSVAVTIPSTTTDTHTLSYTPSDGSAVTYELWLWPVAQYKIVFGEGADGTVTISDGTGADATVKITAADTQRTKYAIGSVVDGGTTIKITSGIKIDNIDDESNAAVTFSESISGSSGYDTFNPVISSQEYTITVSDDSSP